MTTQDVGFHLKNSLQFSCMHLWQADLSGTLGERFQRSNETISWWVFHFIFLFIDIQVCCYNFSYFHKMLHIFSLPPFYTKYVHLPTADDPVPSHICNNPKFWPFFQDTLGAFRWQPHPQFPPCIRTSIQAENRKGFHLPKTVSLSAHSLFCLFTHILGGKICNQCSLFMKQLVWQIYWSLLGNTSLLMLAIQHVQELLVPYHGVRYHLAEWAVQNIRYEVFPLLILLIHILVKRPSKQGGIIQSLPCFSMQCHWTYFWCHQTALQNIAYSPRIWLGHPGTDSNSTMCHSQFYSHSW